MKLASLSHILWALVPVAGCGTDPSPADADPDFEGIEEATEALTDLSAKCTFNSGTGLLTVALGSGDVAMIAKATTNNITINGYNCGAATSTTLKKLTITGAAGNETVILDFMNGTFAQGLTGGAGGIDVDLGGGMTDALKIRGSKSGDTFVFGNLGATFNSDLFKDISFANTETFVVSMSDGNDSFSGAGSATAGATAFATAVTVYGGAGTDTITGGSGNDTVYGGADNDVFIALATSDGDDAYNGEGGTDTIDYGARTNGVDITVDDMADDGEGAEADNVKTDIETIKGGKGADTIVGSGGAETISGGDGADQITGGGGIDILNGDAGDDTFLEGMASNGGDTFNGGAGIDTVSYAQRSNAVIVTIDTTANDGEMNEADKVMTDVENVTGGGGGDTITGSASDNVLDGGAANDTINGGLGNDTLRGGAGSNTLNGDAGDDTFDQGSAADGADAIHGGLGIDLVTYAGRTNDVAITMDGTTAGGETSEGDVVFTDVENLTGGAGKDTLTGNAADNKLEGGADDDKLFGLGGDDLLDGNAGTGDELDCGAGDADVSLDADTASVVACEL